MGYMCSSMLFVYERRETDLGVWVMLLSSWYTNSILGMGLSRPNGLYKVLSVLKQGF
mgnify:CR=1 FL=1